MIRRSFSETPLNAIKTWKNSQRQHHQVLCDSNLRHHQVLCDSNLRHHQVLSHGYLRHHQARSHYHSLGYLRHHQVLPHCHYLAFQLQRNYSNSVFRPLHQETDLCGQPLHYSHPHLLMPGELTPGIQSSEFEERRKRLLNLLPNNSVAFLAGASLCYMSKDIPYSFRQNSDFLYLTGFQEPDAYMMLEKNETSETFTLFVPPRDETRELWDGPRAGIERAKRIFNADMAFHADPKTVTQHLTEKLSKGPTFFSTAGTISRFNTLSQLNYHELETLVERMRVVKSPSELNLMRQAARISSQSIVNVMKDVRKIDSESEIATRLEYECKLHGAERLAYPPVVASGPRSTIIHYIQNNQQFTLNGVRKDWLLLVDSGCEYHGYSSDITRTFPISGKFTPTQLLVYQLLLDAQKALIQKCIVGACFTELQYESTKLLSEILIHLNFLPKSSLPVPGYEEFYPHSIGHFLGMDTHDTSRVNFLKFVPGMVVTVEPGLYFQNKPHIPKEFRGLGIRIEDDVLITSSGPEVLTADVPKDPHIIESLSQS